MIVITCLDQKNGMMFNHRRQSQDSVLREHVAVGCQCPSLDESLLRKPV